MLKVDEGTKCALLWALTTFGYCATALTLGLAAQNASFGEGFIPAIILAITIFVNNVALDN